MENAEVNTLRGSWTCVRDAMEKAKPILQRRGFIAQKTRASGTPYWFIRYRDHSGPTSRLRCLLIGTDPDVVSKARHLLATWQVDEHPDRSPIPGMRESWQLLRSQARLMKRVQGRLFLDHLRPIAGNPLQLLSAVHSWPERWKTIRRANELQRRRRTRMHASTWSRQPIRGHERQGCAVPS